MPVPRVIGEPIFARGKTATDLTISVAATRCATVAVLKENAGAGLAQWQSNGYVFR